MIADTKTDMALALFVRCMPGQEGKGDVDSSGENAMEVKA